MRPQRRSAIGLSTFLSCCGGAESARPIVPAPTGTATANESRAIESPKTFVFSDEIFRFEVPGRGSCHGLFVSRKDFITPAHCFPELAESAPLKVRVATKDLQVRLLSRITRPSDETEDVLVVRLAAANTERFHPPSAFLLPEKILPPYPLVVKAEGTGTELICSPLRYNLGGLVAYDCPTTGSMSGTLLKSPDSKPFAIHLGRKSSLGYGLVLGKIQTEVEAALAQTSGASALGESQ